MGFGALFIGFMFLYDFQIGLRHEAGNVYAMLDIFPDLIGWILIFFGVRTLSRYAKGVDVLQRFAVPMALLSVFTLVKETALFSVFYSTQGMQIFAGEAVDFAVHLLELAFASVLFQKTAAFCRKKGEDKLASSHGMVPRIASVEGALFVLARLGRVLPLPQSFTAAMNVVSMLDYLFMIFLVWFAAISLFRCLVRISVD